MESLEEKNPLVSVIIPVYNGEKYIKKCIDSVINQDYKNIEIIIVDDGSTDSTEKILQEYFENNNKITVIKQQNKGVSCARNSGYEKSAGEYISFVDSDDFIEKEYISYLYKLVKKFDADISIIAKARKYNSSCTYSENNNKDYIEVWDNEKALKQLLYYNIDIGPWNKLINKRLIDKYNLKFDKDLSCGEDFYYSVNCFERANKVVVGHKELYNYRVDNENSIMSKFTLRLVTDSLETQKRIKSNLLIKTDEILIACKYSNWHTNCDCLNTMIGCNANKKYPQEYKKLKKICRNDALVSLKMPISIKQKIKGILYFISPTLTARLISSFWLREFKS